MIGLSHLHLAFPSCTGENAATQMRGKDRGDAVGVQISQGNNVLRMGQSRISFKARNDRDAKEKSRLGGRGEILWGILQEAWTTRGGGTWEEIMNRMTGFNRAQHDFVGYVVVYLIL